MAGAAAPKAASGCGIANEELRVSSAALAQLIDLIPMAHRRSINSHSYVDPLSSPATGWLSRQTIRPVNRRIT
jgi:hypothetical protein